MKKLNLLAMIGIAVASISISMSATSCSFGGSGDVDRTLPTDDPTSEQRIEFWHCMGSDKTSVLQGIVNNFNREYEGKYEVVLVDQGGTYDAIFSTIKTKLKANEVPAIAMGYPDNFSEYMSNEIDFSYILRLDNFINDPNYGYTEEELNDFIDIFLDEGQDYQFEGTWSLPMYKSTEIMYYNANYMSGDNQQTMAKLGNDATYLALRRTVTEAGGFASDADLKALKDYTAANGGYTYEVPVTWDDMITVGRKINADRKEQNITGQFFPVGYDSDSNLFISQFEQRGIPYTTNVGEEKVLFNNSQAKEFATELTGLISEGVLITKNSMTADGSSYTNKYFNDEQAAMVVGSTGGSSYQVSDNFTVKLVPVPYSNNNPKYIMQGPSLCFFNNNNDYIHKGAWLFYKYMADPEVNCQLALENSYEPVRKSSYETDSYKKWIANQGKGLNYDITVATSRIRDKYMTSPVFIGSGTCRDEIGNIVTYVIMNQSSIDTAFNRAETRSKDAVKAGM